MTVDGFKLTPGQAGLTFIACKLFRIITETEQNLTHTVGIGGLFGFIISLSYDRHLRKLERTGRLDTPHREEKLRLPVACIGSALLVIGLFWTGASGSRPTQVHWIVPVLALIPFGAGYMLVFSSMCNYIVDSYAKAAASAMAAATATRSLLAAILPLCSGFMYDKLGIQWGFYLLGFIMLGLSTIPFIFLKYGPQIRGRSRILKESKQQQEKDSPKREDA